MEKQVDFKKTFLLGFLILPVVAVILIISSFNIKPRVVFCDVGQGDGVYIRTKNGMDIVVDAGPDSSILECIGRYMPFFDRTIELVFISHAQKDHYGGLSSILDRYRVGYLISSTVGNSNQSFNKLQKKLKEKQTPAKSLYKNDQVILGNDAKISFLWPTREFIANQTLNF